MAPLGNGVATLAVALGVFGFTLGLVGSADPSQVAGPEVQTVHQDAASQPASQETWLRVIVDEVHLRSRPDANSLPVARVPRDTLLRAVGRDSYGWYRVRPPEGVFSFVAAEYVDRRGPTEGIVSVRGGTLRVRVGSLVYDVDPAQTEVQTLLQRGAVVQVVGEQGAWLKIVPPPGVYAYVAGQHAEPVTDDVAARLRSNQGPVSRPTSEPTAAAPSVGKPRAASGPDLSGPWGQRLAAVETAIAAEARKPLGEQSWPDAVGGLQPIAAQREEPAVARLAEAWIAQLEQRIAEQAAVRAADELLGRTAREQVQHEREMQRIERARRAATQPQFTARGELQRSDALRAQGGVRWYKLVDPVTRRVEAYLEVDADSRVAPETLVGRYVGVRGVRRAAPGLGADVVRIEEIVVLGPGAPETQPATQRARHGP